MLVLMNHEAIVHECMAAAKGRISIYLQLPSDWVTIKLEFKDDRITPTVQFAFPEDAQEQYPNARAWKEKDDEILEKIEAVLRAASRDLATKLQGLEAHEAA